MRILCLHEDNSEGVILQALQQALEGHCYSADGVRQLVLGLAEPEHIVTHLKEDVLPVPDVRDWTFPGLRV